MAERPLDTLLASLPPADDIPDVPIHPRVLSLPRAPYGLEQLFVVWRDPGGARALHRGLRDRIETALLLQLSRVGESRATEPLVALRLILFAPVANRDAAVAAFGLRPSPIDEHSRAALAHARGEASALGREVPDAPDAIYEAAAVTTAAARDLEAALVQNVGDQCFGARPGALFAALEAARKGPPLEPGPEALDQLERELVAQRDGVLRWIPPACFLALADAIGVTAARLGHEVAWAECTPDEHGVAPPPLLRVTTPDGHAHVPVGLELLRWCVMPRRADETVPPLSSWLTDRLGAP